MRHEYFWPLFGMIWVFGWTFAAILWHHLRSRKAERREERAHRERIAALEKGLAAPEPSGSGSRESGPSADLPLAELFERRPSDPAAARRAALGAGLILTFVGLGMITAFLLSRGLGLRDLWSLGFIPMFPGIGLLAYAYLVRWMS